MKTENKIASLQLYWRPAIIMFGKTHSFLPSRNGIVQNTAHILLHLATAATLIGLLMN